MFRQVAPSELVTGSLMSLPSKPQVNDNETKTDLSRTLDDCLINCVQHALCFLINIVEPGDQQVHSQVR